MDDPPFIGSWHKVRLLGSGGFGRVFQWENKTTNEIVAVKECLPEKCSTKTEREKLIKNWNLEIERHNFKSLKCEYIVSSVEVDEEFLKSLNSRCSPEFPVLVMEYCDGGDLRRELSKPENLNGVPESNVRNVLRSLSYAVQYLHAKGITHRDIKPENIVIKKENSRTLYKLTDLGYAKDMTGTMEATQVGTIGYVAPEIIACLEYSNTCDYWSMGIVAFEVINGFRPFIPHQPTVPSIRELKVKTSSTIAITENKDGLFEHHKELFVENHLSESFRKLLEEWFPLLFEYNSRKRGLVFETKSDIENRKRRAIDTDSNNPSTSLLSQKQESTGSLKIFIQLEDILSRKILTCFSIPTFKFLSYDIMKISNLEELVDKISKDTKISPTDIQLVLPVWHKLEQVSASTPIEQLYIEDSFDEPMIFIFNAKEVLKEKNVSIYLPGIVKDMMPICNPIIPKPFLLLDYARKALFYANNFYKHYKTFIEGLKNYAFTISHFLSFYKNVIDEMSYGLVKCQCSLDEARSTKIIFESNLQRNENSSVLRKEINEWDTNLNSLYEKYQKIQSVFPSVKKIYPSLLIRIKDIEEKPIFDSSPINRTSFKIPTLEKLFEKAQSSSFIKNNPGSLEKEIGEAIKECLKAHVTIIKSPEVILTQNTLRDINVEFQKMKEVVRMTVNQTDKLFIEIKQKNRQQIGKFLVAFENEISKKNHHSNSQINNLPSMNGVIENLKMTSDSSEEKSNEFKAICELKKSLMSGASSSSSYSYMDLELREDRNLINVNEELRGKISDVLMEIEESL